jgi:SAM-dependent methyltransferase
MTDLQHSSAREDAIRLQRAYYERTARQFDDWHLQAGDEHHSALLWIDFLFPKERIGSILDVGAGTGRALQFFGDKGRLVVGAEPSAAQLNEARGKGIAQGRLVRTDGALLPFPDNSFDAVCEFGMLHHVERPERVIGEMLRVARKAVFISDANRFGQGGAVARFAKLALYRLGLWKLGERLRTRGKGYHVSERDGLFYSFSVYDHLVQLAQGSEHVLLLPTTVGGSGLWSRPLWTHGHVLVCALKPGFAPPLGRQIS